MITLYGKHACYFALRNPQRKIEKFFLLNGEHPPFEISKNIKIEFVDKKFFEKLAPDGASQHIALRAQTLEPLYLEDVLSISQGTVLILDQINDPRNVGAIFRNAAAFGIKAIIMQDRNSPKEGPTLVKTASGGFDIVPHVIVKNISQAIESLKKEGFWTYGLAEGATQKLEEIEWAQKRAIVMGAEGNGLRHLVRKSCDEVITIDTMASFSTLNVVNASAIVLHKTFTHDQAMKRS